jgi:hypothetical protein
MLQETTFSTSCQEILRDGVDTSVSEVRKNFEGFRKIGGREGDRTLGPRIANAVLSQLSYSPTLVGIYNLIYQSK